MPTIAIPSYFCGNLQRVECQKTYTGNLGAALAATLGARKPDPACSGAEQPSKGAEDYINSDHYHKNPGHHGDALSQ
jgi:hypothetical protein